MDGTRFACPYNAAFVSFVTPEKRMFKAIPYL